MFVERTRFLVAVLWVGSLWTVGYLVAPTLFITLSDKILAGTIAGSVFRVEAWLSVACALLLIILLRLVPGSAERPAGPRLSWLVLAILGCTVIGYFSLEPFMAALRETAGPGGVMASAARTRFAILHGASSIFYLIESLLGVWLLLRLR